MRKIQVVGDAASRNSGSARSALANTSCSASFAPSSSFKRYRQRPYTAAACFSYSSARSPASALTRSGPGSFSPARPPAMTRSALTAIPWLQRSVDVGAERRVQVAAGADGAAGGREHRREPARRGAPAVGDLEVHAGLDHHDVCAARAVGLPARVDVVALLVGDVVPGDLHVPAAGDVLLVVVVGVAEVAQVLRVLADQVVEVRLDVRGAHVAVGDVDGALVAGVPRKLAGIVQVDGEGAAAPVALAARHGVAGDEGHELGGDVR